MDAYTTPGQDLFEAVQGEMLTASPEHAKLAQDALYGYAGKSWTWGALPAHVKAIFSLAAARFLSE